VGLLLGCGPTIESGADDDETGRSSRSETTANDGDPDGADATATDGADEGPLDPCMVADPEDCPERCARTQGWTGCPGDPVALCVSPGSPIDGPQSTWWTRTPQGPVFLETGERCGVGFEPAEGWTECTGSVDEPADCACFCQQGYCPGDEGRKVLDSCDLEPVCNPLLVDPQAGVLDHAGEACVYTGLRDRTPGLYQVFLSHGFVIERVRLYVGERTVHRLVESVSDLVVCPMHSDWGEAQRCSLAPSAYFEACTQGGECHLELDAWAIDCVPAAPVCD
jgi:hypothetical protein